MLSNIYGNPHSASTASQLSTRRIDDARTCALRFFNADPKDFDLIFVANATAGIKLVMDAFRNHTDGFWYGYHQDAHTSLVGVREAARAGHHCFASDAEVEDWIHGSMRVTAESELQALSLFAYPAQSNMNGRRLPLIWSERIRSTRHQRQTYTLLDAAAFASTSPLHLSNSSSAPDFTVLSFYKIFGFPDLGALIVRKESGNVLKRRDYFGGGTVDMVASGKKSWHMPKQGSLHEQLEDGTLPVHSILALHSAFDVHAGLYGSMDHIAEHTEHLSRTLFDRLNKLRHYNSASVCVINEVRCVEGTSHGPIIAFNFRTSQGTSISNAEVEKLAAIRNIQLRSGGLCNPGGVASSLGLAPWELRRNFSAGQRCGNGNDVIDGKPTGLLRVSLGAMSNMNDVNAFISFAKEFFVEQQSPSVHLKPQSLTESAFYIEALNVYPIKSCGAWSVPPGVIWVVRHEGLAWDREWCVVHQGTRQALSQKKYPRMSMIKPCICLDEDVLRIRYFGENPPSDSNEITVPLSADPTVFQSVTSEPMSQVCGDPVAMRTYTSSAISSFFSDLLGTPCTLARYQSTYPSCRASRPSPRYSKIHPPRLQAQCHSPNQNLPPRRPTLLLSNESPILVISRSSLNRLNENIKQLSPRGKAAKASVFRANIVVAEEHQNSGQEKPYAEDDWSGLRVRNAALWTKELTSSDSSRAMQGDSIGDKDLILDVLGGCRRCQMVCIDQTTAEKDEEPFVTLSKTRRRTGGGVYFGVHTALSTENYPSFNGFCPHSEAVELPEASMAPARRQELVRRLRVGDCVWPINRIDSREEVR